MGVKKDKTMYTLKPTFFFGKKKKKAMQCNQKH